MKDSIKGSKADKEKTELEKDDNRSGVIAENKALESNKNDPKEKDLDYFKDAKDNIEDRRTGETYDKDRLEGYYKHAVKDENDVNPIDARENERGSADEHTTPVNAEETDGDDHDVVRPNKEKTIEKDEYNKDNADTGAENQDAKNKAGESYNSKKNK